MTDPNMNALGFRSGKDSSPTYTLVVTALASFLTPFMSSSVNVALPIIGKEFGLDAIVLGWIPSSFLLAAAIFLVPCGRIADLFGRKKVFTYGIVLYTVCSLFCGLSGSVFMLIGLRVVQGVGGAMIFGTGVAILIAVYPAHERGKVLGINVATTYVGLSLGPFLGGILTHFFGWRSVFLVNVPIGVIILLLTVWKLQGEWLATVKEEFDFTGSIIYALALAAVMYGLTLLPEWNAMWLLVPGAGAFVMFVRWELRVKSPVLEIRLFRENRVFAFSNLAALINYSATFAVTFLISLYLQYIKGLDPSRAGMILVAQPIVMAVFSPVAGRLSDRIEPRIVSSAGMGLTVLGLVLFAFLQEDTSIGSILITLSILGLGFALFSSPNTNAVMSSVERSAYGIASATLATMRLTGQMFSMGMAMLLLAVGVGRTQVTPGTHALFLQSSKTGFVLFALLCTIGVFASLARGKVRSLPAGS